VGWADGDLDGSGHVDGNDFSIVQAYFDFVGTRRYPSALRTTSFVYDALGRVVQTTLPDPDGAGPQLAPVSHATYDALGNVLTTTDALGNVTSFSYDALGRLISETDAVQMAKPEAERVATTYHYYVTGNLKSLTDPDGNATTWVYDDLDRMTAETNALGATRSYWYNAAGQLQGKLDRNGRVTTYSYDHLGRVTSENWYSDATYQVLANQLTYTYDAWQDLTASGSQSSSLAWTYDVLGRMTQETATQTFSGPAWQSQLASSYDAAGNRRGLSATINGVGDFANQYQFDALGRMSRVEQHGQSGGSAVADKRVDFRYNAAGQFDAITRYANLLGTQVVATSDYSYDQAGRLTALRHRQGANTLASHAWTFDSAGRMTGYEGGWRNASGVWAGESTSYANDATGQLTVADHAGQTDESYQYDANGNRSGGGFVVGPNNRILSDGVYSYQYDAEGNRTQKYRLENGLKTDVTAYGWDHRNRLIQVRYYATAGSFECGEPDRTITYGYDSLDRLVHRWDSVDGIWGSPSSRETRFAYDGNEMVVMDEWSYDGDFYNRESLHRYLYGPAVDQVLADDAFSPLPPGQGSGGSSVVRWLLGDHLNTVRDIAEYDAALGITEIANHRVFNSFGKLVSETDSTVSVPFGFTARYTDPFTGHQWHLHRWYDTALCRWISEDPTGLSPDVNPNRYCGNSPTDRIDPMGLRDGHH
jgi:RHS repeat-associated protein